MDWDEPAIVLDTAPYGDHDLIATVMTAAHGAHRGLIKGGASRAQAGTWQVGNFLQARWNGRLSEQLGHFRAELVHATAAAVMDAPLSLAMLSAVCAVSVDALPEREPHEAVFSGLVALLPRLVLGKAALPDLVRWETMLLADLGYGLDLTRCAVTGATAGLAFVSPRSGRAVTVAGAGEWADRLLPLPAFLASLEGAGPGSEAPAGTPEPAPDATETVPGMVACRDGLRLTGHFLARDVFGARHRPVPMARLMLYDRVAALAAESENQDAG